MMMMMSSLVLLHYLQSSICECGPACRCVGDCGLHFTRKSVAKQVEVKWTGSKGWGVFTCENIKQGEYVMAYIGEYLTVQQAQDRLETYEESGFNVNYQVGGWVARFDTQAGAAHSSPCTLCIYKHRSKLPALMVNRLSLMLVMEAMSRASSIIAVLLTSP